MVDGHVVIPESATQAGTNRIELEFTAGDEALNRNDDFLYTLFYAGTRTPRVSVLRSAGSQGALHAPPSSP